MKKIFIDNLPLWLNGKNKNNVNWEESIGMEVLFEYDDIKDKLIINDYIYSGNGNNNLKIEYKENYYIFSIPQFRQCAFGKLFNKYTTNFKFEIGQILKDDRRNLEIVGREYRDNPNNKGKYLKWYKYKCKKCNYEEGWIIENSLTRGSGCSCCSNKTIIPGINDIPTTAPWLIPYFQGGYEEAKLYSKSSGQKIKPICPDCGRVKDKEIRISDIYNQHSIGCNCSDGISYPNKFMYSVLEQLNLEFENEYSPEWIKPKRYDFYIPSMNLIIEMDGGLGHGNKSFNKTISVDKSLNVDNYKDEQAVLHGLNVIRIDCKDSNLEYIKGNIYKSELKELLPLSLIEWVKVEEFALNNLVKESCDLWNKNNSIENISILLGLTTVTVRTYLKKGKNIGWCNYSPYNIK